MILASSLAAALAILPPAAGDWRHVSSNQLGATFVDAASVAKADGKVRFWTWEVYRKPVTDRRMDNSLTLYEAGCADHRHRILQGDFRGAETLLERDEEVIEGQAKPGSSLYAMIESVCRSTLPTGSTASPYRMLQQLGRERGARPPES